MAQQVAALALLAALASACAAGHEPRPAPPDPASAASREFQRDYDASLRADPTSFLTTVAAYYLAPGDTLTLALTDANWRTVTPDDPDAALRFAATAEALTVDRYGATQRLDQGAQVTLDDRFALSVSRQELDWRVLIHDRSAPRLREFAGVEWFPVDPQFIVEARFAPRSPREPMLLQTSRGVQKTLYVAGEAEFELAGAAASLLLFAYAPEPSPGEPLLIPFRDASSGEQSYAAGRYLELEAPTDARLLLDFNRATNPLCAYSEHYNCPMPPRFNTLTVAIEAGAMSPR